jgi:hypothetical protein
MRNAYRILVREPAGKRSLGKLRLILENNIRIDHRDIVWEYVDWKHLAQERDKWWALVNTVMNLRFP